MSSFMRATTCAAVLFLAGALPALAEDKTGRITEVREAPSADYGTTILVDVGSNAGVGPGQTVEVRREGKVIGYGSVDNAFSDVAVATVGTIVTGASPLLPGDEVVFRGAAFQRPPNPTPPPAQPPASDPLPRGRVVNARESVVMIELDGAEPAAEVGMEVSIKSPEGQERGRLVLELVNGRTAAGELVSGEAVAGDAAVAVARAGRGPDGIDYVALSFLGVVTDLEHPTPHRAPCHVGVPVRRVMPGSPAQRAGIGRGDRVIAIDGMVVRDVAAIRERIEGRDGNRVQVSLIRADRILTMEVVFR